MDNKQLASAYSVAKVMGFKNPLMISNQNMKRFTMKPSKS